jgi:hypothetical protein
MTWDQMTPRPVRCLGCHRGLTDREAIYCVSLHQGFCADCVAGTTTWRPSVPCEGCGRPIFYAARHRPPPCHAICGAECRAIYVRSRRERMRDLSDRRCAKCGSPFTAQRDNARYCSSPCRQKAYRQRRHQAAA